MKTAKLFGPGDFRLDESPDPPCAENGVIVGVKSVGICSADVKMIRHGHRALTYPRVLGHEIAGVVKASASPEYPAGSSVLVYPGIFCGRCSFCRRGLTHRCRDLQILGFNCDGGFAEYLSVPLDGGRRGALLRLPEGMSFTDACLAEPLACCINSQLAVNTGNGDVVWIAGAGPLGLMHLALAKWRGARRVIVTDPLPERRDRALRWGADAAVTPAVASRRPLDDDGIDVLILASSDVSPDHPMTMQLNPGGRVALFSSVSAPSNGSGWDLNPVHYRELRIAGSYGCSLAHFEAALTYIDRNMIPVGDLVTSTADFNDIQAAMDNAKTAAALKTIVEVNHG